MSVLFVVLGILVLLVVAIAFGAFRTSRTGSRRSVVGRSRPRLGLALLVVGLAGLVGGQVWALASAPGDIAAGADEEIRALVPKEGAGTDEKFVVNLFTWSDLVPDEPLLLEHLSLVMSIDETATATGVATGGLAPGDYTFTTRRTPDGRVRLLVDARVDRQAGTLQSSTSFVLDGEGPEVHYLNLGSRATRGRFTALFPGSAFPATIVPATLVVIARASAGVADAPVEEVMAPFAEKRVYVVGRPGRHAPDQRDSTRGIVTLFGQMGIWAWLMLALAGVGSALLTRRPGLGLGLFLLLAPILVAGLDHYALTRHRAALRHADVRVRASALAGLQGSVLFATSGQREVAKVAAEGAERDAEVAERIRTWMPRRNWERVRSVIGIGGRR